jgi:hypothetical protein
MIDPVQRQPHLRQERPERSKQGAAEREIARAEEDYQRLRSAYLSLAREERNEVALAMVGADMDRAHAVLQDLTGLRQLPFTHESTRVVRREAGRLVGENC